MFVFEHPLLNQELLVVLVHFVSRDSKCYSPLLDKANVRVLRSHENSTLRDNLLPRIKDLLASGL